MMLSPHARRACSVTAHADAGSTGAAGQESIVGHTGRQLDGPRIPNPMPVEYLGRIGNRYRQGTRPSHQTKADFDIEYEHTP